MDIANKAVHIKAKDVGVVFRQDVGFVNSITLQDAYGTLSFDDSPISLDLPGSSIKLPLSSLPSLTLRLGNIAEKKGQSVIQSPDSNLHSDGGLGQHRAHQEYRRSWPRRCREQLLSRHHATRVHLHIDVQP